MKPITAEWVDKAEQDYHSARLLLRARKHPNFDGACFHAQQCIEKYMKALLVEHGIVPDRTHDLDALLARLTPIDATLGLLRPAAIGLTDYAVRFRYPGASADRIMANDAVRAADLLRLRLRQALGMATRSSRSTAMNTRRKTARRKRHK